MSVSHVEAAQPEQNSLIPSAWNNDVRHAKLRDKKDAGLALAHSFASDPLSLYILEGDDMPAEKRWELHVRLMRYTFASYRLRGAATAIGADFDSVALWMPPGKSNDDLISTLCSGMWRLRYQLPRESRCRVFDELFPALHDAKQRVLGVRDDDSYYLGYIGTKATSRGMGYATRLIQHIASMADAEHRPVYLESSADSNVAFYMQFGFVAVEDIVLRRSTAPVRLVCMVREPQNRKANGLVNKA